MMATPDRSKDGRSRRAAPVLALIADALPAVAGPARRSASRALAALCVTLGVSLLASAGALAAPGQRERVFSSSSR